MRKRESLVIADASGLRIYQTEDRGLLNYVLKSEKGLFQQGTEPSKN